jgi:cyanophycinase
MQTKFAAFSLAILLVLLAVAPAQAQSAPDLLIPAGGGYGDVYDGIVQAMFERETDGAVTITVLPSAYATDAFEITDEERAQNIEDAEVRRSQIEEACLESAPEGVACVATTAPIFVRADAEDPANLAWFGEDVDGVFILGGDQAIAMQVLAGTPVEDALAELYGRRIVIAGTSAGAAVLSQSMIAGYSGDDFDSTNALNQGSVLLWQGEDERGLNFGVQGALLDQHFFQRGRPGRLLEAISRPDAPHVGVGVDAYTALRVEGGTVFTDVFGLYTAAVLDAETLGAAAGAQYVGEQNTLRLRNVLVHLLAPGGSSYDLATRTHSLAATLTPGDAAVSGRTFDGLVLPEGAGPLILAGRTTTPGQGDSYAAFVAATEASAGPLLVVAAAWPNDIAARRAADKVAAALAISGSTVRDSEALSLDEPYAGIVVLGYDQAAIDPARLSAAAEAWRQGAPLLLERAAAAIAGAAYSQHGSPVWEDEVDTQQSMLAGSTTIADGLNLLPVTVEVRVLETNRWGRLFSLAYSHPDQPALAIGEDTALLLDDAGATVLGEGAIIALDLRGATLALGSNDGFAIANGLLDVFTPSDAVAPNR